MVDVDGPRWLRPEEFGEAMALAERCFGFDPDGLEDRFPHCFDEDRPARHAVVTVDGEIASHAVRVPVELVAGDARIPCGGIAGVATRPDHRGNGYMTRVLEFCLADLAADGVPIAELEGDRPGYARFGFENAGRERRFRIDRRSLEVGISSVGPDVGIRRYDGTARDLDRIEAIHERDRYRVVRDREQYRTLFGQQGLAVFLAGDPSGPTRDDAYIGVRDGDPASVLEFGGSRDGVAALLDRCLRTGDGDELVVYAHPHHELVSLLVEGALDWRTIPHRKLRLLDLPALLEAYRPLLSERWTAVSDRLGANPEPVTLAVDENSTDAGPADEDPDPVTVSFHDDGVSIERPDDGSADLALGRREMTRLLFGDRDAHRARKRRFPALDTVLPLEYYFWRTETV